MKKCEICCKVLTKNSCENIEYSSYCLNCEKDLNKEKVIEKLPLSETKIKGTNNSIWQRHYNK